MICRPPPALSVMFTVSPFVVIVSSFFFPHCVKESVKAQASNNVVIVFLRLRLLRMAAYPAPAANIISKPLPIGALLPKVPPKPNGVIAFPKGSLAKPYNVSTSRLLELSSKPSWKNMSFCAFIVAGNSASAIAAQIAKSLSLFTVFSIVLYFFNVVNFRTAKIDHCHDRNFILRVFRFILRVKDFTVRVFFYSACIFAPI